MGTTMQSSFQPLRIDKAPRYREAAYQAIKEAILAGQVTLGQALVEEQIATELQISRTPVREALAILQHEQLIAPRGGRGLYVRELTREEVVAMFVANEAVEPFLVRQAALQATEPQLAAIRDAIEIGRQAAPRGDIVSSLRSGRDFHRAVGVASGNEPLTQFVANNEERTDLYLLSYGLVMNVEGMEASNREHLAIYTAIAERDPEAAVRLSIYHSQSLRQRLAELFTRSEDLQEAQQSVAVAG